MTATVTATRCDQVLLGLLQEGPPVTVTVTKSYQAFFNKGPHLTVTVTRCYRAFLKKVPPSPASVTAGVAQHCHVNIQKQDRFCLSRAPVRQQSLSDS